MMIARYTAVFLFLLLVFNGCDPYKKIKQSNDMELKYNKAKEYYNQEEWDKAIPLFEQLINIRKGTQNIAELYYYFAYSYFGKNSYLLAAYHFKKTARTYPKSKYAEECLFMYAYCYYLMSPSYHLDQKFTEKAISAFQLFVNKYPNSDRVKRCNRYIDKLREKLKKKAFESARLYYKIGYYQAATEALGNVLEKYPDIAYKEKVNFLILESRYKLAKNSIQEKKRRRYQKTLQAYRDFKEQFPNSEYMGDAQDIRQATQKYLNQ